MSEKNGTYSQLSMCHKRRIVAANRIVDMVFNYIALNGNNDLVRLFQRSGISFAHKISEHEVNEEMAKLDKLVEEVQDKGVRPVASLNAHRRRPRS